MSAFNFGRSASADGRDARSFAGRGLSLRVDGSGAPAPAFHLLHPSLFDGDGPFATRIAAILATVVLCIAAFIALAAPQARAAGEGSSKVLLQTLPHAQGEAGGNVEGGRGVAVNGAGSFYVPNVSNRRVEQFNSLGQWIRAFGYDVVKSGEHNTGANEQQTVTLPVTATGGTFTLRWPAAANTTAAIPFNASPAQVQTALEAITTIGSGNVGVSSPNPGGGVEPGGPYTITFQGALGGNDQAQVTAASSLLPAGTVAIATITPGGDFEICEAVSTPTDVCKVGSQTGEAGALSSPEGIALDQETGNVFVADNGTAANSGKRISVFSASGEFQGAFGVGVDSGGPGLEFCTILSTCQAGAVSAVAGGLSNLTKAALGVDPTNGNLYVGDRGNSRVSEFSFTLNGSDEVIGVGFERAFGWDVIPGGFAGLETCTAGTGCQSGVGGGGDGQFSTNTPNGLAIDSEGFIYAVSANDNSTFACNETTGPCRVQKFNPDGTFLENFGPSSGGAEACQLNWTSGNAREQAANGIVVDPATGNVYVTRKASASGSGVNNAATFELCEFESDGTLVSQSPLASKLATNNQGYLQPALGSDGFVYINAPTTSGLIGVTYLLGPVPAPGVQCIAASEVGTTTARLSGKVIVPAPGGAGYEPKYRFEYSGDNGLTWSSAPESFVPAGSDVAGPVDVTQDLVELQPNRIYRWKLVASTSSQASCEGPQFKTSTALPAVSQVRALPVTDTTATLRGSVNPNNVATTYRFEWGTTTAYGNQAPSFEPSVGSGGEAVNATAGLTGLQPGTTYHYRLVATNSLGEVAFGSSRTFLTSSCPTQNEVGLPDCRRFELVSPADQGPVGEAGGAAELRQNLQMQASPDGNRLAYVIAFGLPSSTSGSEVVYRSERDSATGWAPTQLAPPLLIPAWRPVEANAGQNLYLSRSLDCGFLTSFSPMKGESTGIAEASGAYLYRHDDEGGLTLVPEDLTPVDPSVGISQYGGINIIGASSDCRRLFIATRLQYPGIDFSGEGTGPGLYEWSEEEGLENAAVIPGPSGPVVATGARAGARGTTQASYAGAVSKDGDRLIFTSDRKLADGPGGGAELNKAAVFVREDGGVATDVSRSQTSTPAQSAFYQAASSDGSRIFFLGNYGLTSAGSNGGTGANCTSAGAQECDLYEYDLTKPLGSRLTSLTATTAPGNTKGAVVAGVLDSSPDGTAVYFAAQGQLVPGKGNTYAQNGAGAGAYNVYLARDTGSGRTLSFVAVLSAAEVTSTNTVLAPGLLASPKGSGAEKFWSSRTTPSGSHLLFQTRDKVTGYDSGGAKEAYLYSAESETTVCVSCRSDGQPSVGDAGGLPLVGRGYGEGPSNYHFRSAALSSDGSRVFFISKDALATGAVAGNQNLYQWEKGVVSLIATHRDVGLSAIKFLGASANGDSVFFRTPQGLVPEDTDGRSSVYVARVNGGFDPPTTPTPCDPLSEDSCAGPAGSGPSPAGPAASATFQGEGNLSAETPQGCKANQVRRGNRCVAKRTLANRACAKRRGKAKQRCVRNQVRRLDRIQARQQRATNTNGRAGK